MLTMAIAAHGIPGAGLAAHRMLRMVLDMRGFAPTSCCKDMTHLPVPTLFGWGDRDAYAPPSSGQSLARQMPHARLEIITDAGHVPKVSQPTTCRPEWPR
jgi:pimeloyl-ACP methyl ester carboxylesterase